MKSSLRRPGLEPVFEREPVAACHGPFELFGWLRCGDPRRWSAFLCFGASCSTKPGWFEGGLVETRQGTIGVPKLVRSNSSVSSPPSPHLTWALPPFHVFSGPFPHLSCLGCWAEPRPALHGSQPLGPELVDYVRWSSEEICLLAITGVHMSASSPSWIPHEQFVGAFKDEGIRGNSTRSFFYLGCSRNPRSRIHHALVHCTMGMEVLGWKPAP